MWQRLNSFIRIRIINWKHLFFFSRYKERWVWWLKKLSLTWNKLTTFLKVFVSNPYIISTWWCNIRLLRYKGLRWGISSFTYGDNKCNFKWPSISIYQCLLFWKLIIFKCGFSKKVLCDLFLVKKKYFWIWKNNFHIIV